VGVVILPPNREVRSASFGNVCAALDVRMRAIFSRSVLCLVVHHEGKNCTRLANKRGARIPALD
jgi:hypothetical protein